MTLALVTERERELERGRDEREREIEKEGQRYFMCIEWLKTALQSASQRLTA